MNNFIRDLQQTTGWGDGNIIQTFIDFIYEFSLTEDCQAHFAQAAGWDDSIPGETNE